LLAARGCIYALTHLVEHLGQTQTRLRKRVKRILREETILSVGIVARRLSRRRREGDEGALSASHRGQTTAGGSAAGVKGIIAAGVEYHDVQLRAAALHKILNAARRMRVVHQLIEEQVLPRLADPIRYSPILDGSLRDLVRSVKAQGLEGLVAKRRDSKYEPGLRSGAWQKMRVNAGQELVIGGYTPSPKNFDALVIGYYDGDRLIYVARTRNGFTPVSRVELFKKIKPLEIKGCPFANLPEKKAGRWGAGLTAAKMAECWRLNPALSPSAA
jgi:hypothetical protein